MDELAKIIGANIDKLREQKRISIAALARIVNVTRQTMGKYIRGEQVMDTGQLFTLADFFNVPVDYFFSSEETQPLSLAFRAFSPIRNADDSTRLKIERRIEAYCDTLEMSDEDNLVYTPESYRLFTAKDNELTSATKNLIEQIAYEQRTRLGIGDNVVENLYEYLDLKGIRVLGFPFNNDKIFAVSAVSQKYGCFIVINDDEGISEERKIFSLMHEYAHLLFHREDYRKNSNALAIESRRNSLKEKTAEFFAGKFLVPRHLLEKRLLELGYTAKRPDLECMFYLKKHFRVSLKAIIKALVDCGRLTRNEEQQLYKFLNSRGYNKKEPKPIPHLDKNICFTERVKRLYLAGEISTGRAAELLDIDLMNFRNVVARWLEESGEPLE